MDLGFKTKAANPPCERGIVSRGGFHGGHNPCVVQFSGVGMEQDMELDLGHSVGPGSEPIHAQGTIKGARSFVPFLGCFLLSVVSPIVYVIGRVCCCLLFVLCSFPRHAPIRP